MRGNTDLDQLSQKFFDNFMLLLKMRFGTKRIHANQVYHEYNADRNRVHMNASRWETLTDFVKWLDREGHCLVDKTERGLFISYIDRDHKTMRRQEALMKLDSEERMAKLFKQQRDKENSKPEPAFTELKKTDNKIIFSMKSSRAALVSKRNALTEAISSKTDNSHILKDRKSEDKKKKNSALEEIMMQEKADRESMKSLNYAISSKMDNLSVLKDRKSEDKKRKLELIMEQEKAGREKKSCKDHWHTQEIIVKRITKKLENSQA